MVKFGIRSGRISNVVILLKVDSTWAELAAAKLKPGKVISHIKVRVYLSQVYMKKVYLKKVNLKIYLSQDYLKKVNLTIH